MVGKFGGDWHPLIASIELIGEGIGQLRRIEVIDGKEFVERLEALDDAGHSYRYGLISGIPASDYQGSLEVAPRGNRLDRDLEGRFPCQRAGGHRRPDDRRDALEGRPRRPREAFRRRQMKPVLVSEAFPVATSGKIAVLNHRSARRRAWARFWHAPELPGLAEAVVEQEDVAQQFLGDVSALDRLTDLAPRLETAEHPPAHVPLVLAQIASMQHRFADADNRVASATAAGAPRATTHRLELAIDQACGRNLDTVLEARRRTAQESGRLEDLVPLGALLADLGDIEAADRAYLQALRGYDDVSPFALAWVCFQLGMLWGELATQPDPDRATSWYRQSMSYLPRYARARVHLAEILTCEGRFAEAKALLVEIIDTGDPEIHWRLAEGCLATGERRDAERHLGRARVIYAERLGKYPLAYADHGAEFERQRPRPCPGPGPPKSRQSTDVSRVSTRVRSCERRGRLHCRIENPRRLRKSPGRDEDRSRCVAAQRSKGKRASPCRSAVGTSWSRP